MASLVLAGDTSGSITVAAPAVAGSNTQTLVAATDTLAPVIRGTTQTAPFAVATYAEFTGIPSWVKRITVMLSGVSTNSTSGFLLQLGTSSGIENTGYISGTSIAGNGSTGSLITSTAGFVMLSGTAAASTNSGAVTVSTLGSNIWVASGTMYYSGSGTAMTAGTKTTAATLDRVRITTISGDTFDAGSINILYE
jgi:hypothetical protein